MAERTKITGTLPKWRQVVAIWVILVARHVVPVRHHGWLVDRMASWTARGMRFK